ncbi:MAG: hypothetical protein HY870_06225 [Chloroflexi bacterium]|nr:hypothetical protein [Chloroflexota bacterium]
MMENPEVVSQPDESTTLPVAARPRRTGLIIIGVVALAAVLAGAAFVGGRLLNQLAQQTGGPGGMMISGGPGGGGQAVSMKLVRAKELPEAEPAATGLFAERKDNSIFVTIGNEFMVQVDENGTVNTQTDGNGQQLEVVVTGDTILYKDVTQMGDVKTQPVNGELQQQVAPGSLDEIGANSLVTAWGERRGDRVIASVLFYSQPMMFKPAAP